MLQSVVDFICSALFAVKSLYKRRDAVGIGCGDKGLSFEECKQAVKLLGYNPDVSRGQFPDMPEGCVIGTDADSSSLNHYTTSFYNLVRGVSSDHYKSICFEGI